MGLPKKLTEQQMRFAYELVTNEGRKTVKTKSKRETRVSKIVKVKPFPF